MVTASNVVDPATNQGRLKQGINAAMKSAHDRNRPIDFFSSADGADDDGRRDSTRSSLSDWLELLRSK